MINFESLVISLPAHQFSGASFAESVFAASELKKMTMPRDLRIAVELIFNYCPTNTALRCVARPEIFTNGVSLEWLRKKIDGVTDHLNLSEGTSLKLIPGLRNHVFLYGLQSEERLTRFRKLCRRAPELFKQFDTQLNSFHRTLVRESEKIVPTPQMVMSKMPFSTKMSWFCPLYLNPHSLDDSVDHMLGWGAFEEKKLVQFDRVAYLPLTDIGSRDVRFRRMLCESIAMTFFEDRDCLLIRLPSPDDELASRMKQCIACIQSAQLQLPRTRAQNVFLLADDLSEQALQQLGSRLSLMLHHSFEFWRYSIRLYEAVGEITYYAGGELNPPFNTQLQFLSEAFGRTPVIVSAKRAIDESYAHETTE